MRSFCTCVATICANCILALVGCSDPPSTVAMPAVNAENCKAENLQKIPHKPTRDDFASRCFRRGSFKPSPPQSW